MDEDRFNLALRSFLKEVGVTSQREIGETCARAAASGRDPPAAHGAHLAGCPGAKPCDRARNLARLSIGSDAGKRVGSSLINGIQHGLALSLGQWMEQACWRQDELVRGTPQGKSSDAGAGNQPHG